MAASTSPSCDGWWDEAYAPELGWAIGDRRRPEPRRDDAEDAEALYDLLEQQVVPEFYDRDATGHAAPLARAHAAKHGDL